MPLARRNPTSSHVPLFEVKKTDLSEMGIEILQPEFSTKKLTPVFFNHRLLELSRCVCPVSSGVGISMRCLSVQLIAIAHYWFNLFVSLPASGATATG